MTPERQVAVSFAEHFPEHAAQADLMGDLTVHAVKEALNTLERISLTAPTAELAALAQLSAMQLLSTVIEQDLNKLKNMVDQLSGRATPLHGEGREFNPLIDYHFMIAIV